MSNAIWFNLLSMLALVSSPMSNLNSTLFPLLEYLSFNNTSFSQYADSLSIQVMLRTIFLFCSPSPFVRHAKKSSHITSCERCHLQKYPMWISSGNMLVTISLTAFGVEVELTSETDLFRDMMLNFRE